MPSREIRIDVQQHDDGRWSVSMWDASVPGADTDYRCWYCGTEDDADYLAWVLGLAIVIDQHGSYGDEPEDDDGRTAVDDTVWS
jgi:hypothetical protein